MPKPPSRSATPTAAPRLPGSTPQAEAERAARVAREAAALRENLARRKRQQREKAEAAQNDPPAPDLTQGGS